MKKFPLTLAVCLLLFTGVRADEALVFDGPAASRFSALVLKGARQEYPNKLDHVMSGPGEVLGPKALHPAFYGCFDWHSAVHGHWLLVRVLKEHPGLPENAAIVRLLDEHLNPEAIGGELAYLKQANRRSFERTYGWAWLLKLAAELETLEHPRAANWRDALRPLAQAFADKARDFFPRQDYPIRTGVHPNTAYSLSLTLDYAQAVGDKALAALVADRAMHYFAADRAAPLGWEPGGEDFLSPSLEEAALMVRVLPREKVLPWLRAFLPALLADQDLQPARVSDRSDPKIVHLDGLNLSRARCLYTLAALFPKEDALRKRLCAMGDAHAQASLPHITSGNYEGEHWLGTFAVHMLLARARL